jgi:Lrp/AsnC family leucine-responsive transcriptional regulator
VDNIDRKIIRNLQKNGRLTNNELAEMVALSPSPCLRRMRKLEKQGVIKGYTAVIDEEKYGLPINVFIRVKLEKQSEEHINLFEDAIQNVDEILEAYLMTGTSDYLLHVVSADLKGYEYFMKQRLTKIPGIATVESSFAISRVKEKIALPYI